MLLEYAKKRSHIMDIFNHPAVKSNDETVKKESDCKLDTSDKIWVNIDEIYCTNLTIENRSNPNITKLETSEENSCCELFSKSYI